ncbi:hypothetical protein F8M41_008845 [Gigaspora margarita]|uniref:Uncharacterized protein n=1 Tax=Gigaspora margarita TaxID=4874 RepID=A0A8H4AVI3_GIGMA|nr:hypothetical protein F8M41_008845 [Gigaspora margarita]
MDLKLAKVKSLDGRDDIGWCYQYGIGIKRKNKKGKWFVKDEENNAASNRRSGKGKNRIKLMNERSPEIRNCVMKMNVMMIVL